MQQQNLSAMCTQRYLSFLIAVLVMLMLSACGSRVAPVRFKVNSEPEGAYVLYQVQGTEIECAGKWVYLGNTPLQGMYQFDRKLLRNSDKISLRVMQQGYMDQTKEWTGASFYEESKGKGVIFWTPEMIPAGVR
ncbi:MAG: hypothetical protein GX087_06295 [Desulfobulbaceae bacterium]|nr:hypothetical protein [Desulfobulbaceae bacterium]